jgi:hypothetical protein
MCRPVERSSKGHSQVCEFSNENSKPLGEAERHQLRAGGQVISLTSLMLLRKEVIQPHVPVRLPCYDLVPVTDPALGSSLQ